MKNEVPKESAGHWRKLRAAMYVQTRALDAVLHALKDHEKFSADDREIIDVTIMMIQGLGVSVHSVLKLTEERDMAIRDCLGIARAGFELATNICFITAAGVEEARRAQRHALQKSYRDLHRIGEIGGVRIEVKRDGLPKTDTIPGLEAALAEFSRKGREVRDWTPLNISARIDAVRLAHEKAALSLSVACMSIYRHSSELVHGTFFGVQHFWTGSRGPARTREAFYETWAEHFQTIFNALYFSVAAVIELCSARYKLEGLAELISQMDEEILRTVEALAADPPSGK